MTNCNDIPFVLRYRQNGKALLRSIFGHVLPLSCLFLFGASFIGAALPDNTILCGDAQAVGSRTRLLDQATLAANGRNMKVTAQWDTGANCTSISQNVVRQLGLRPYSSSTVYTPSGNARLATYKVNITLPNGVFCPNVEVDASAIGNTGIDLLIGMDIISRGNLTVTRGANNQPKYTFTTPQGVRTLHIPNRSRKGQATATQRRYRHR